MPSDLQIRPTEVKDIPLLGRSLGANQAFFYANRLMRRCVILSAWLLGEPVAALCVSFDEAEENEIRQHLPGVPLLYRLFVRADARGKGVGSALLDRAEKLILERGHHRVAVGVDESNHRAIKLYRHRGYAEWEHGSIETTRERYTDGGELETLPDFCRVFVKDLATTG